MQTSELRPYSRERIISFTNDTIHYIAADTDAVFKAFSLQMVGYDDQYVAFDILQQDAGNRANPLASFSSSTVDTSRLYLADYPERSQRLTMDSYQPKNLAAGYALAVWAEPVDLRSADAMWYDVKLYDVRERNVRKLPLPDLAAGTSRVTGDVCGAKYLMFQEVSYGAGATGQPRPVLSSTVYVLSSDAAAAEPMASRRRRDRYTMFAPQFDEHPDVSFSAVACSTGTKGCGYASVSLETVRCTASWLETAAPMQLNADLTTVPVGPLLPTDVSVHIIDLPSREKRVLLPADYTSGRFTALAGHLVSDGHVVLVLATPDGSEYLLRNYHTSDRLYHDVPGSASNLPIRIADAHSGGFLFWQQAASGAGAAVYALHFTDDDKDPYHMTLCKVVDSPSSSPLIAVALYADTVVWAQRASSGTVALYRLDLDKDNDDAWDSVDAFPLLGVEQWDADNDGVGDNEDLIAATGSCVYSSVRGACWSDYRILYVVWGIFMGLLILTIAGVLGAEQWWKRRAARLARVREQERRARTERREAKQREKEARRERRRAEKDAERRRRKEAENAVHVVVKSIEPIAESVSDDAASGGAKGDLAPTVAEAPEKAARRPAALVAPASADGLVTVVETNLEAHSAGSGGSSTNAGSAPESPGDAPGAPAGAAAPPPQPPAPAPGPPAPAAPRRPSAAGVDLEAGVNGAAPPAAENLSSSSSGSSSSADEGAGLRLRLKKKKKKERKEERRRHKRGGSELPDWDRLEAQLEKKGEADATQRRMRMLLETSFVQRNFDRIKPSRTFFERRRASADEPDAARAAPPASARRGSLDSDHEATDAEVVEHELASPFEGPIEKISLAVQVFLILLTLASVATAFVPLYVYEPLDPLTEKALAWFDWFTTTVFLVDFVTRLLVRDRATLPTVWSFIRANKWDIPSLIPDIPGVGDAGFLSFLVITRLTRLLRILRVFRLFRLVRLYHRLTHASVLVILIVERPIMFLSLVTVVLVLLSSILLKIVEQDTSPDFRDFGNVVWYTLVTEATIGYGDYRTSSILGRALSMMNAMLGIGLLGALSGKAVERFLTADASQAKRIKSARHAREKVMYDEGCIRRVWELRNPLRAAIPRDPLAALRANGVLGPAGSGGSAPSSTSNLREAPAGARGSPAGSAFTRFRRQVSVALFRAPSNPTGSPSSPPPVSPLALRPALSAPAMTREGATLPPPSPAVVSDLGPAMDEMEPLPERALSDAGAGAQPSPRNRAASVTPTNDGATAAAGVSAPGITSRVRKLVARASASWALGNDYKDAAATPSDLLRKLLRSAGLESRKRSGLKGTFQEFWAELQRVVFDPPRQNELAMEKLFTMMTHQRATDGSTPLLYYDLSDPMDQRETRLDDLLVKFTVDKRPDFDDIRDLIFTVILIEERYQTARWCLERLRYKPLAPWRMPLVDQNWGGPPPKLLLPRRRWRRACVTTWAAVRWVAIGRAAGRGQHRGSLAHMYEPGAGEDWDKQPEVKRGGLPRSLTLTRAAALGGVAAALASAPAGAGPAAALAPREPARFTVLPEPARGVVPAKSFKLPFSLSFTKKFIPSFQNGESDNADAVSEIAPSSVGTLEAPPPRSQAASPMPAVPTRVATVAEDEEEMEEDRGLHVESASESEGEGEGEGDGEVEYEGEGRTPAPPPLNSARGSGGGGSARGNGGGGSARGSGGGGSAPGSGGGTARRSEPRPSVPGAVDTGDDALDDGAEAGPPASGRPNGVSGIRHRNPRREGDGGGAHTPS